MTHFDQRGQKVFGKQYNTVGDITFGLVNDSSDFVTQLEKLQREVSKRRKNGMLDKKKATDIEYQITKAAQEAEDLKPEKKAILNHLITAKSFIEGVTTAGGLVTSLAEAIEAARKIFS